jgi:ubiquinone/menaquinone biosynthesis C-methylase UbiE
MLGRMAIYQERVLPHLINVAMNVKAIRPIRARVAEGLAGDVVEIGFGTGHNLPYLPTTVTRLRAVEPSKRSVALAAERIAAAPFPVEIVGLDGESIPLPDDSADAVLCTWSLCTIPDAVAALREMGRVLKPGGELHFVEHGRSPDAKVRVWQDRLNPMQNRVAGGCNLNRDIPALLAEGGFTTTSLDTYYNKGEPKPFSFTYEGRARLTG